jgi:pimeloyl-ACP methyl ester carboxylesterase
MRWKLIIYLIVVSLIQNNSLPVNAQKSTPPTFEKADCKFTIPAGMKVDCGYVSVPQDRSVVNSRTIRIYTALFHAKNPQPDLAPVVFLDGGPGVHSLDWTTRTRPLNYVLQLANDHDLILFDQRGTGYSQPALDCPEITQLDYAYLDQDPQSQANRPYQQALGACHDRLVREGVNPAAFSTAASAADVNDLRLALGYAKWNLYGVSYGTRLAQSVMKQFPQGVRSVVLDSSLVGLLGAPNYNRRSPYNVLFTGCANSPVCNMAYPNLSSVFNQLVRQLNQNPVTISIKHPVTGKMYAMLVTGDEMETGLFWGLYSTRRIPTLPKLIYDAHYGDYSGLATLAFENDIVLGDENISEGMNRSVNCIDQFAQGGLCQEWLDNTPPTSTGGGIAAIRDLLSQNGNGLVTSDLPTLVLGGEYDPVTPPSYAKAVTQTLKNSEFLEFPGTGHEAAFSGQCPMNIVLAFYTNPAQKPDSSCILRVHEPTFVVPEMASF